MTTNVKKNKLVKFDACETRRRQFVITGEYDNIFSVQAFKKMLRFLRLSFQCFFQQFSFRTTYRRNKECTAP